MTTFKKNLINIIILLATINGANAASIDYEDLRGEYKDFNDESLNNVTEISNYESLLFTTDELDALVRSKAFIRLKELDLSGHKELTDEHIKLLCNTGHFPALLQIDLSDCKKITKASLQAILESPFVGFIRNLPQISDRYGRPSSEIRVRIGGKTNITREEKRKEYVLRSFAIEYRLLNGELSRTFRPVKNGMKILNIEY